MNENIIKEIVNTRKEDLTLEFKNYKNKLHPDIYETVCSFSNRNGGIIIIGISDKAPHKIVGVDENAIEQMQKEFTNGCANPEIISPKQILSLEKVKIDNKYILVAEIYPTPYICKYKKYEIFDRSIDGDFNITNEPELITLMTIRKNREYSEDEIFPYCTIEDFRSDVIDKARKLALINNPNHPWKNFTNEEILQSKNLYIRNPRTGERGYTLACILLFGSDELILSACPHYRTDCIKRINNLDRYDDRDDIRTNLVDTYFKMMEFINKHLDDKFILNENGQRISARNHLFREAICNHLIHREFRNKTVSRMIIEKDKVIFENGCIPYSLGYITLENVEPKPRNPKIAKIFNEMGLADELGSGIKNMYKYNKIYCDATPTLIDGNKFKTIIPTIPQRQSTLSSLTQENKIINFIQENKSINSEQIRKLLNIEKSRAKEIINIMVKNRKMFRHGNGKNTYYDFDETV